MMGSQTPASAAALTELQTIRSAIPAWRRTLAAASSEAGKQTPNFMLLHQILSPDESATPAARVEAFKRSVPNEQATLATMLGLHAQLLCQRLTELGQWWGFAAEASSNSEAQAVIDNISQAQTAVDGAMLHVLFISFLDEVRHGRVGEDRGIDSYCAGWGLASSAVNALWSWLLEDPHEFDGKELPIVFDTTNRVAYRKATGPWWPIVTVTAPLWSMFLVFGLVALLFELLHGAGIYPTWPGKWVWRLLALVVFVWLGALAHVGAQALNVYYSDPMKIYDAGSVMTWLSLRWLAVVKMHVPIAVVVASLWGAGNVPTTFQTLGTALLAGYGADSLTSALLSRLSGSSSSSAPAAAASAPTTGATG